MEAPNFWDDTETSQKKMKELKSYKDDVEVYRQLETSYEDIETLIEMGYEENDASIIPEIEEELNSLKESYEQLRIKTLLSGEYEIREGEPDYTGRLCVIGTDIEEHRLEHLFELV